MAFGCMVSRLNGLGQYTSYGGGGFASPTAYHPTNYGAYALNVADTTPQETVTVTACGYGSPVTGNAPTFAQYAHKAYCELLNMLDATSHLRANDLWQSAWKFAQDIWSLAWGTVGNVFRPAYNWGYNLFHNVTAPVAKAIGDAATWFWTQLKDLAGKAAGVGENVLLFLAAGVGLYFAAKVDPNKR